MTAAVDGVVPLPGGPVCGMSAEEWEAAAVAGTLDHATVERVVDAARDARVGVRAARRAFSRGHISQVDYDDVRDQYRSLVRRATDAGGMV